MPPGSLDIALNKRCFERRRIAPLAHLNRQGGLRRLTKVVEGPLHTTGLSGFGRPGSGSVACLIQDLGPSCLFCLNRLRAPGERNW